MDLTADLLDWNLRVGLGWDENLHVRKFQAPQGGVHCVGS